MATMTGGRLDDTFNDNSRKPLKIVGLTLRQNPAVGPLVFKLAVDGELFSCEVVSSVLTGGVWLTTIQTLRDFAGPAVDDLEVDGARVLLYGRHDLEVRITLGPLTEAKGLHVFVLRRTSGVVDPGDPDDENDTLLTEEELEEIIDSASSGVLAALLPATELVILFENALA